jgi:hypothetical protein
MSYYIQKKQSVCPIGCSFYFFCKTIVVFYSAVLIGFLFFTYNVSGQIEKISNSDKLNEKVSDSPYQQDEANFHFTSIPDFFNWNIKYPQPGWEEAVDWFLLRIKEEGPAFTLHAGDIMDARWWSGKEEVIWETYNYWGGFRRRFEDKNIKLYIAPGDHEYGDDQGLKKMHLTPVFAKQFVKIFDMPLNGPEHMKELAYSFSIENLAVISVNTFEDAGDHLSMTVSGKQLEWFNEQLIQYQDKEFIIVQGHVPVVGPVKSKNSSANMLEGGVETEFWKTMVKYGVDVYLCGEHHRITAMKHDGIWQIVHGALWGTQPDVNYLKGSVYQGKLKLELFEFIVEYSDGYIMEDHPHRGPTSRPHKTVTIPLSVKEKGPTSVGQLIIEYNENGNQTVKATGKFH